MERVGAEALIALEGALAELSALYVVAKEFRALQVRAESELLNALGGLGARLRRLVRSGGLDERAVDQAAAEIAALRQRWREALAELHASDVYRACLAAWQQGRMDELTQLLPQLLSNCALVVSPRTLFHAVSPSSGRRRPGQSPFVSAHACAEQIVQLRQTGIAADITGHDWWDTELLSISLATDAQALESPVALRFEPDALDVPVFATSSSEFYRVFVAQLIAPFSVTLQSEVDDEWWQAFAGSYASWRDALAQELSQRGIAVDVQSVEGAAHG